MTTYVDDTLRDLVEALTAALDSARDTSTYRWPQQEDVPPIADAVLPVVCRAERRAAARALRDFADAHRFPSDWITFRSSSERPADLPAKLTVADLLRETADRIDSHPVIEADLDLTEEARKMAAALYKGLIVGAFAGIDPDDAEGAANVLTANLAPIIERQVVEGLGLREEWLLCGHPAWPDPLHITPPTREAARDALRRHPHPDAYILRRRIVATERVDFPEE
jgi:hypothetical protein